MPAPLIPASAFAGPRRALLKVLVHSCTYTPITTTEVDGDELPVAGVSVSGMACKYTATGQVIRDATGRTLVSGPTLKVAHDAVLAVGGVVSQIVNSNGDLLIAGPLAVLRRRDSEGLGLPLLKTYELHGADPLRAD